MTVPDPSASPVARPAGGLGGATEPGLPSPTAPPASAPPATAPPSHPPARHHGRTVGRTLAAALLITVTVLLVLFVVFNTQTVDLSLVFGNVQVPLVLALVAAAVLGGLVVALAGLVRRARRNRT